MDYSNHSNTKMEFISINGPIHPATKNRFSVYFLGDYFNNPTIIRSLPSIPSKAPIECDKNFNPVIKPYSSYHTH